MYSMAALYRRRAHSSTGKPVVFCLRPHKLVEAYVCAEETKNLTNAISLKIPQVQLPETSSDDLKVLFKGMQNKVSDIVKLYSDGLEKALIAVKQADPPLLMAASKQLSDASKNLNQVSEYFEKAKEVNSQPPKGGGFKPLDACKAS